MANRFILTPVQPTQSICGRANMTVASTIPIPPGLPEVNISRVIAEGGVHDREWDTYSGAKCFTNAFVLDEKNARILLGFKKRGFGASMYNGFGGKVEPDESPLEAAKRELKEEAGIEAPLVRCGTLFFTSPSLNHAYHIDVFRANIWVGTPSESEEMRPEWFSINPDTGTNVLPGIPYDRMWADDKFWLPLLLAGTQFIGRGDFGELDDTKGEGAIGASMVKWWFASVDEL
ncbi:NUDIX hydrolase domain-like protein [Cantharellus anzutake]|uniref:NUDIX hydrolase domain-like protein n=1 Tax=Cantharellus anzutake TaxID=1750568 RepID=UPI001903FC9B|nr:NUDIX hydrolase domain-like protein [Cantharellus anzutake]KAF8325173.1 NUDIX hydrolase domain-like protein [Cantharellus anzutake]